MNKGTKNNGITLIALVISIIVMLILVAVSISMAVNGGLFNYAGKAVGDTQNAIQQEQDLINDIIENYIKPNTGEKEHEWTRNGDTFKCLLHNDEIYEMGDEVEYTAITARTTLDLELLGFTSSDEEISEIIEQIEVVKALGLNPTVATQTEEVKWRVLGIDEDTGSLLITTENSVCLVVEYEGDNFPIGLPICTYCDGIYSVAYVNGINEMNRICKELYSNNEYGQAKSMTIEDVNKTLKHNQPGGITTTWPDRTYNV